MNYELYEILLFFSIYSIFGWIIELCCFQLTGKDNLRPGIGRGPWCTAYGIGALLVIIGAEKFGSGPVEGFILGVAAGTLMAMISQILINGLSGEKRQRLRWYQPGIFGICGILLVYHIHPLLTTMIRWGRPWIHLIFLMLFWIYYPGDFIEGIADLLRDKKKSEQIRDEQNKM